MRSCSRSLRCSIRHCVSGCKPSRGLLPVWLLSQSLVILGLTKMSRGLGSSQPGSSVRHSTGYCTQCRISQLECSNSSCTRAYVNARRRGLWEARSGLSYFEYLRQSASSHLALFPGSCAGKEEREPGTVCPCGRFPW